MEEMWGGQQSRSGDTKGDRRDTEGGWGHGGGHRGSEGMEGIWGHRGTQRGQQSRCGDVGGMWGGQRGFGDMEGSTEGIWGHRGDVGGTKGI